MILVKEQQGSMDERISNDSYLNAYIVTMHNKIKEQEQQYRELKVAVDSYRV
jgi:hypothetical protein